MVGRSRDGVPLVGPADEAIEGGGVPGDLNAFTYRADPHGLRCPLGAHVRRSNPRNADLPPGPPGIVSWAKRTLGFDSEALDRDRVASTRFHRLLRRGREYGVGVSMAQALAEPTASTETGLHFICLGANIARQFEFVQNAWAIGVHFDGLPNEGDPLLGTRVGRRRHAHRRLLDAARRRRRRAPRRPAAVRHRARRRLLLPARHPRPALPGLHAMNEEPR